MRNNECVFGSALRRSFFPLLRWQCFFLVEVFIKAGKAAIGKNGNLAAQAAQIPLRERPRQYFIIKISDNGITELKLHKLFSHALHLYIGLL